MSKRKPEPFSDSFTTEAAEFSVEVRPPWGESSEAIVVKIDCAGEICGDAEFIDVLIGMLENAKENLRARQAPEPRKRASRAARAPTMLGDTIGSAVSWTWNRNERRYEATTESGHVLHASFRRRGAGGWWTAEAVRPADLEYGEEARSSKRFETSDEAKDEAVSMLKLWLAEAA